ncbi:MAG: PrsW family intramembrane metalloprotease [Anaerolineales bacterium]|nr:PrsW family intramembrane metalloprotease [Anaerolineales bacterium]
MSPRASRPAKPRPGYNWVSLTQFLGSSFGLLAYLSIGLSTLTYVVLQPLVQHEAGIGWDFLLSGSGALWAALLLVPSLVFSLAHLLQRPVPATSRSQSPLPALALAALPLVILIGHWLLEQEHLILLPPVHVAAASLSVGGLVWLGIRKLQLGGRRLVWGGFASGLTAAPLVSILLEAIVGICLLAMAMIYIGTNQDLLTQLTHIESALPHIETREEFQTLFADFFNNPVLLGLLLTDLSLFTPLIEELFKPIALWLLIWRRPFTPAQGFAIGLLGGAGFALLENLFSGANTAEWVFTSSVRFGATAFHIATAGLMGWAIVRAKNEARYLDVFLVYGFNILLHGLWNGIVVLQNFTPQLLAGREVAANAGLVAITVLCVAILIYMNKKLQPPLAAKRPGRTKAS